MSFILLADLHRAAPHRPPGYLDEVLSAGKVIGDRLEINPRVWASLRRKYAAPIPSAAPSGQVEDALEAEIKRLTGQAPCRGCGR